MKLLRLENSPLFLLSLATSCLVAQEPRMEVIDDPLNPFLFHHEMTVNSFLNADGFGARRVFDSVPGLHGALNASDGPWLHGDFSYRVGVHDLLGVLKAEKPRVYPILEAIAKAPEPRKYTLEEVSAEMLQRWAAYHAKVQTLPLPKLPYAADNKIPIRELDTFEHKALAILQAGHALVKQEEPTHVRMLGAIRAQETCLKCHDDKKPGDLLGAFTYFVLKDPISRDETNQRTAMEKLLKDKGETAAWEYESAEEEDSPPLTVRLGKLKQFGFVTPKMLAAMRKQRACLPTMRSPGEDGEDPLCWEMKVTPIRKPAGKIHKPPP